MKDSVNIFWFRRDLRLEDNSALSAALAAKEAVLPIFIFDTDILSQLENAYDRRVDYIYQALEAINTSLNLYQSCVHIFYGKPLDIFESLQNEYDITAVYCNRDYEPKAIKRDALIKDWLANHEINFFDFKDQVIFEKSEVLKNDGQPYTVFTPYMKKWRSLLLPENLQQHTFKSHNLYTRSKTSKISLTEIGFEPTDIVFKTPTLEAEIIKNYGKYRDFPAMQLTTQLGMALRFGTISIRKCVAFALASQSEVWLSELVWREFFMQILYHFPRVTSQAFKAQYDFIHWRNDEAEFQKWCEGKTGYPIVDAGMRQLNQTGYMHNRVRMIVAGFLCKHLLIDWRWGEAYFAQKLNDFDLAANNGNWQWAAGSGCDAAPYFRVFNPNIQTQKFDKNLEYIKQWNPDFETTMQKPIVVHEMARERALKVYKQALQQTF